MPRLDTSHGNKPLSHSSHSSSGQSNNKFRCRVAMACVHCRHRKIRCDGAQPSCYTCTRLQRKCEYERVSEQDNLLSRERKRLSRERKAARLAASASQGQAPPATQTKQRRAAADEKHHAPKADPVSTAALPPSFPVSIPPHVPPTEIAPALIQSPSDAMSVAWSSTHVTPGGEPKTPSTKDLMPWVTVPPYVDAIEASVPGLEATSSLAAPSATSPTEPDSLVSLRSTADPSLLELSAPPSALSDMSPTLSPTEPYFGSETGTSKSGDSISSEATHVDPLELTTSLDTPLKLFSDQPLPPSSTMAPTPHSLESEGHLGSRSDGPRLATGFSPLSPQLAPPSMDPMELGFEDGATGGAAGCVPVVDGVGSDVSSLYSSSLPISGHAGFGADLEPSSLPILSSWTHPTPIR